MTTFSDMDLINWTHYVVFILRYSFKKGDIVWPTMPELLRGASPTSRDAEGIYAAFKEMEDYGTLKPAEGAGRWFVNFSTDLDEGN